MDATAPAEPPRASAPASAATLAVGALLLAAVLGLVAVGSLAVWVLPAALVVGLGLAAVRPGPLTQLGGVLALMLFQLRGDTGTTPLEALSGLALVAYLATWYGTTWLAGRRVVTSAFDVAALTWGAAGLAGGMILGQIFGADAYDFRADVIATIPFLLYLPVKDACARYGRGPLVVAGALVVFGLVSSIQSVLQLREIVSGATQLYEIADARVPAGEAPITVGLLLCFAGSALTRSLRLRVALLTLVGVLLGGLILAKSRAFWVACVVGVGVIALAVDAPARRRLGVAVGFGAAVLATAALTFFADEVMLLASGALNRLLTLSSVGQDISLLNRFSESAGAWERIRMNPILGYGWGVQFTYFSPLRSATLDWAFQHNGYLALWYKTGLWGLGLMAFVWGGAMVRAAAAARSPLLGTASRAIAVGVVGTLTAFTITVFTSNPFSIFDQMLFVTLTLALAHGVADRGAWRRRAAKRAAGGL